MFGDRPRHRGVEFLAIIAISALVLLGCSGANSASTDEDASQNPGTTVNSSASETTAKSTTGSTNVSIEAPDYDPQAVQPENGPQLSEARIREAVDIGLADPRLKDVLTQNDFRVSEVMKTESMHYRPEKTDVSHPAARVTVVLDDPVPLEESGYDGDVCDVGGATGPITGMVWVVDFVEESVAAFSPQWNYDVSCT